MPGLISIEEARSRVQAAVRQLPSEQVAAPHVLGRVLAEDVAAEFDLPPFRSSAMDGFAVIAGDGGELPVVGESRAGHPYKGALRPGEAVRISTGAVVPEGADAVVPIERVAGIDDHPDAGADALPRAIWIPATQAGAHLREAGEDVRAG